jgi:hypothetical protein
MPDFENEESQKIFEKAERAYVKGNYERSAKLYDELMAAEGQSYELTFNQLTSLVHTKDTAAIEHAFIKLAASAFLDCNYLTNCKDFREIKYRTIFNQWREVVQACQNKEKKLIEENKISLPEIRTQLLFMKTLDVESDVKVIHKIRYGGYEELSFDSLRQWRSRIYKENFSQLLDFIKTYGWLGKQRVGVDGAEAAWLVAQHGDHAPVEQARLLPILKAAVDTGEAPMRHYAYLFDQVCANYRQPQRFGTLRWKNPDTGAWEIYKLEDPEKVNDYRKEAGLSPLKLK